LGNNNGQRQAGKGAMSWSAMTKEEAMLNHQI
jgi:hypothetical protein